MFSFYTDGEPVKIADNPLLFGNKKIITGTIHAGVATNAFIYFDGTDWKTAVTNDAQGINGTYLTILGLAISTGGFTAGKWYYKNNSTGALTDTFSEGFQVIGFAISATELMLMFFPALMELNV
jgi:hypothetical protein